MGDVLSKCSATILKAGKENQFEREGYGQRPYDNWETIMFDCNGQVCVHLPCCDKIASRSISPAKLNGKRSSGTLFWKT
jgi:hypothetical protein